jgi:hypothetical protein
MANEDVTWADIADHLEAAIDACRRVGDDALGRLALRLEAELIDLRYQRSPHDA